MNSNSQPIVAGVVTQHAEEAAFLWLLRDGAVHAPHFDLRDLAKLDLRVEAHIDGLRIAGEPGWEICRKQLASGEAGEVFAAGVLSFERGDEQGIKEVLGAGAQSVEVARSVVSSLGWLTCEKASPHIHSLLESGEPLHRRIAIAAAAVHRQDPGDVLKMALDQEPVVRSRALRAAGELGRVDLLPGCQEHRGDEDAECRFWAAWSAGLLGDLSSTGVLREFVESGGPRAERACVLAARRVSQPEALDWMKHLAGRPEWGRLAVVAAGAIGDPELIPWLLELMRVNELARLAGESFSSITGIDLAYEDLEGEWPDGFEAGPTEDAGDEDVAMDPDEDLPWPALALIENWWSNNKGRFTSGKRYLNGTPITEGSLGEVLRSGKQRQRAAAALELALRQPGQPLFEVRARGDRQQKILSG